MDNLEGVFNNIANTAKKNIKKEESDYMQNGLLYCGKCHTPKQCEVEVFGKKRTPMCLCKCEIEKAKKEKEETEHRKFLEKVKRNRKMGFPESDMTSWTFANDDLANERITKAMRRYVDNFPDLYKKGKGLLLYGPVGTGKTFFACEVANALIDKGYPVMVTNFARLTNIIQESFEDRQKYIDSLNDFKLLVIDDLGAERKSEYMQEMVFNIVDSRYRAGLPFIITTNLTISEIKEPTDIGNSRIYDRILERCFPIQVAGSSRRRKAVKEDYHSMKDLLGL